MLMLETKFSTNLFSVLETTLLKTDNFTIWNITHAARIGFKVTYDQILGSDYNK